MKQTQAIKGATITSEYADAADPHADGHMFRIVATFPALDGKTVVYTDYPNEAVNAVALLAESFAFAAQSATPKLELPPMRGTFMLPKALLHLTSVS